MRNAIVRRYTAYYPNSRTIYPLSIYSCRVRSFMQNIHRTISIETSRRSSKESKCLWTKMYAHNLLLFPYRQKMREEEDKVFETRRQMIQRGRNKPPVPQPIIYKLIPRSLLIHRRSIFVSTAFLVIGIFAYYFKSHANLNIDVIR